MILRQVAEFYTLKNNQIYRPSRPSLCTAKRRVIEKSYPSNMKIS
jgi:hypothetical protein